MRIKTLRRVGRPASGFFLAALLVTPLVGVGCGTDACSIFNCDTLFFVDDMSTAFQTFFDEFANAIVGTDGHEDEHMDGDMHDDESMAGDEHDEMEGDEHMDGEEDMDEDEHMDEMSH